MNRYYVAGLTVLVGSLAATITHAMGTDNPVLTKVMIDQLEVRETDEHTPGVLDAEGWIGKDLEKLWIKTDMEYVDGEMEDAELQLLYSRAVSAYWDLQLGIRHDFKPSPEQTWGAIGLEGLAPGFIKTDAAVFFSDDGQSELRLQTEYEFMLSQKLVLTPELELIAYGNTLDEHQQANGLASISAGVRLAYEIHREFAPYIGVHWNSLHGDTADLRTANGEKRQDTQWVVGIRVWF